MLAPRGAGTMLGNLGNDLYQAGWAEALCTLRERPWNPLVAPLACYLALPIRRAIVRELVGTASPVTCNRRRPALLTEVRRARPYDTMTHDQVADGHASMIERIPALDDQARQYDLADLRARVRARVDALLAPADACLAHELLGRTMPAADLASLRDVPVREIYNRQRWLVRHLGNDPVLRQLWKEAP